jgi:hypothetical protein
VPARHLRAWTLPVVLLTAASVAFTWPLVTRLGTHLAGGPGDNLIFYWNLWWFRTALFEAGRSPFTTTLLFHPDGASLAYHTTTLLNTVPGAGLGRLIPLPVVYNLLVIASFVLAGLATWGLAMHVLRAAHGGLRPGDRAAALFAAVAYAFAPFHAAHLGHLNILTIWPLPLAAWAALRAAGAPRSPARAALLGGAVALCGLADPYWLVAGLVLVPLVLCVGRQAGAARPSAAALGAGLAAFAVLVLPLVVPALQYGTRGLEDVRAGGADEFVADLVAWVLPSPLHPLWGDAMRGAYAPLTGNLAEQVVFPTFTVWILALLAWRRRVPGARPWLVVAIVFAVLALGPALHVAGRDGIPLESARRMELRLPLPKLLLDQLPLVSGARAASRFAAGAQLGLVLAAALALSARAGRRGRLVALGLVGFECLMRPLPTTPVDIPPAYRVLRQAAAREAAPGALLEIPPAHAADKVYQLYQTHHGLPILGGRLARGPRASFERLHADPFLARLFEREPLRAQDGLVTLDGLDSLGVRWVVLHDDVDPRSAAIARVLACRFETVPTPPGPERLLRRRAAD